MTAAPLLIRWCGLLTLIVFLGISSGCALTSNQKVAVSQFSASAAILGDVTSSELSAMHANTVKMTIERLLLSGKSKDPRLGDQTSLDRGFELKRVETVTAATTALAAYGKSLVALVDNTQSAALNTASNTFVASLGHVPTAKEHIDDQQLEAIGTVVQDVSGFWIEWKRQQAVKVIVTTAQKSIEHLCDLLIRDFNPGNDQGDDKGWIALQLQIIEDPLMAEATNGLYDKRTYHDRRAALKAFRLAHDSRIRRTEVLKRVMDSATAMKLANAALVHALSDSAWSFHDIREFSQKVRSLHSAVTTVATKQEE